MDRFADCKVNGACKRNPAPDGARNRKALLLAYAFPPENVPGAARSWRFYRYLPEFGYEPLVITASRQDPEKTEARTGAIPALPDLPGTSPDSERGWKASVVRAGFSEDGVIHIPDTSEDSAPYSARWIARAAIRKTVRPGDIGMLWVPDALRAAERMVSQGRISVVWSTFPALNAHLTALNLKRRYGIPWVADFRDPLCGNPFSAHTRLSRWFEEWMERTIFAEADILIGVTDKIAAGWRHRYPQYAHKIHTIWNGFDPENLIQARPIPQQRCRVLAHIGTFYGGRTPAALLGSLQRLIQSGRLDPADLRLRFVGDYGWGFFTPSIQATFDSLTQTGCLEFEDRLVPRSEALRVMTESDYLYLADNSSAQSGYTVPAKLFEYIQVGRPILATTSMGSPVDDILNNSGIPCATLTPDATEERVDMCLSEFLKLPSDPVTQPSPWFQEKFNGRRQTGALAALFDSVVSPG